MPTARGSAARAAAILAVALALCPSTRAETAAPPASTPRGLGIPGGALVAPGPAPDLTLLYTGDVVGYVEPCG